MTAYRPFTLDVTDFGPIARACVELRPLTVFVGPSNTGKSWLATLVYALHRYFGNSPRGPGPRVWMTFDTPLPEGAGTDLVRIAEQFRRLASPSAEPAEHIELTAPVTAAIRMYLEQQSAAIGEEIERCFGVDTGARLTRRESAGRPRILLRNAVEGTPTPAVHELTVGDETWAFLSTIPSGVRIHDQYYTWSATDRLLTGRDSEAQQRLEWEVIGTLARDVLTDHHPAFYLPADRTGLMNAHGAMVRVLIRSATMGGIRGADTEPPLSGLRGDFLEQLVEMASRRQGVVRGGREPLRKVAERIEDGILGGAIRVESLPGIAYPRFTYHPRGWESGGLPLSSTSSMVSELAPVVLYLRHVVAPGDLLIIDEPESHLHPAMQVAFTRLLAEIVGAGVRIILTTHSEWVLEELGNVVGRARLTNRSDGKADVKPLDARDVGVWLFEAAGDGPGSKNVQEIALDADTGLFPSGFDTVAAALHNEWAEIADRRGDAK